MRDPPRSIEFGRAKRFLELNGEPGPVQHGVVALAAGDVHARMVGGRGLPCGARLLVASCLQPSNGGGSDTVQLVEHIEVLREVGKVDVAGIDERTGRRTADLDAIEARTSIWCTHTITEPRDASRLPEH
jgi:hypothetical protein